MRFWLAKSHVLLRWIFQTSRSMAHIGSVRGRARSLLRLPMIRRSIESCWIRLLRVDGRDGQGDGFANSQTAGVDQGETAAVDRLSDRGDQAAAVRVASNVGKAFAIGLADFFFVSRGHS